MREQLAVSSMYCKMMNRAKVRERGIKLFSFQQLRLKYNLTHFLPSQEGG
jgi:hypothetical protein